MHRVVLLTLLISAPACWSSTSPKRAPPTTQAPVATEPAPKQPECAVHPSVSAARNYECANEAMAVGDYASVDKLVEFIRTRFPYSKYAVKSEILQADVLAAKRDFARAITLYDDWLKFHPTNEDVDEVKRKREAAAKRK